MKATTAFVVRPQRADFYQAPVSGRLTASKRYDEVLAYALDLSETLNAALGPLITVTSLTIGGGSLLSITTATAHGLSVGSNVTLSGMTDTNYNGDYVVDSVGGANVFYVTGTYASNDAGFANKGAETLSAVSMVDVSGPTITLAAVTDKELSFTVKGVGTFTAQLTTSDGQTMETPFEFRVTDEDKFDAYA